MDDTEHFTSDPDGVNVAWKGVRELWEKQLLCDVKLVAQGQVFQVHRCYMAACSMYFKCMFTQGFRESKEGEVEMHGVTAQGLKAIIHYMYTGSIEINTGNINDILQAASLLQIDDVQSFCSQYILRYLDLANCLEYLRISDFFSLNETTEQILEYVLDNYDSISETDDFLRRCDANILSQLLSSDSLKADSEASVFDSLVQWLVHDTGRMIHAEKLLKLIRYGLLKGKEMEHIKSQLVSLQTGYDIALDKVLQDATDYHHNIYEQPLVDSHMVQQRVYYSSFVGIRRDEEKISGEGIVAAASPVVQKRLRRFTRVGQRCCFMQKTLFAASTTVNNFLFVAGGMTNSNSVSTAFRYNASTGEWLQLADMNDCHCDFALVALSDCLVSVGGNYGSPDSEDCVEKYSFKENVWTRLPPLDHQVSANAGCALSGLVFISGGVYSSSDPTPDNASTRVRCFDFKLNAWSDRSAMNNARMSHAMVAHGEQIFVCGGETGIIEGGPPVLTSEVYDVKTDQWSFVTSMPISCFNPGAACFEGSIYIVGGERLNRNEPTNVVMRYDIDSKKWIVQKLPLNGLMWNVGHFLKVPVNMYYK